MGNNCTSNNSVTPTILQLIMCPMIVSQQTLCCLSRAVRLIFRPASHVLGCHNGHRQASRYPAIIAVMFGLANGIMNIRLESLRIYAVRAIRLDGRTACLSNMHPLVPYLNPMGLLSPNPSLFLTYLSTLNSVAHLSHSNTALLKSSPQSQRQQLLATKRTLCQDILLSLLLGEVALKNSQLGVLLLLLLRVACYIQLFVLLMLVDYCLTVV
ncbi:hypothetical protein DER45DRAFT_226517 [Fusarium avenaceum]|nr:hypothetical protein DER45DRAFT_226517 [Fusarium avenaceum]